MTTIRLNGPNSHAKYTVAYSTLFKKLETRNPPTLAST